MAHLSSDALLDIAEGGMAEPEHLDGCARCREQVSELRRTLLLVRQDAIPEPSPLFWEHLSARIRTRIEAEAATTSDGDAPFAFSRLWRGSRWALATVAVVIAIAGAALLQTSDSAPPSSQTQAARGESVQPTPAGPDTEDDAWLFVAALAEGLDAAELGAAGLNVAPGTVERELLRLSDEERQALAGAIEMALNDSML